MGTKLTAQDSYDNVISPNNGELVNATAALGQGFDIIGPDIINGICSYRSLVSGIRVRHTNAPSMTLDVTVSGNDITVQLATDGSGNVISTCAAVKAKFLSVAAAVALASMDFSGTGGGLAGVRNDWLYLGSDSVASVSGSIRPPLQALTNRTQWLRAGIVDGVRSLKSVYIDGVGSAAVTATAGEVFASSALQLALTGTQGCRLEKPRLIFRNVGTGTADGNPPIATALVNELRPINLLKAHGRIISDGAGGFTNDGIGYTVSLNAAYIQITLLTAMNTTYTINSTLEFIAGYNFGFVHPNIVNNTTFRISIYTPAGATQNPLTSNNIVHFMVAGRQTS